MSALSIELFAAATDEEAARYRILAGLQEAQRAFSKSRVYPHLGELIRLRRSLNAFIDGLEDFREALPGRVAGVDWENGALVYERSDGEQPLLAEGLARWAFPLLTDAVEEGRTLFEFVDARARLDAVGLMPAYQQEGYLLVPEHSGQLFVLRYSVSSLADQTGRYRTLRTTPVDAELPPMAPPQHWRDALAEACPDLPAPALFRLDTDMSFPVEETMLPVAKRKLLRLVTDQGQA